MRKPFDVSKELLDNCATAADGEDSSCSQLFEEYSLHYARQEKSQTEEDVRYDRFLRAVQQVYQHNRKQESLFQLSLNQFSDQPRESFSQVEGLELWDEDSIDFQESQYLNKLPDEHELKSMLLPLHTSSSIKDRVLRKSSHHSDNKYRAVDHSDPYPKRLVLPKHMSGPFRTVELPEEADGLELMLKLPKKLSRDKFATSLNWATTNNPDKVPIVHDVFDQVCNSFLRDETINPTLLLSLQIPGYHADSFVRLNSNYLRVPVDHVGHRLQPGPSRRALHETRQKLHIERLFITRNTPPDK